MCLFIGVVRFGQGFRDDQIGEVDSALKKLGYSFFDITRMLMLATA